VRGEKLVGLALAFMLALSVLMVGISFAQAATIAIEPGFVAAMIGDTVTFNITVYNVQDLNSWQLKIKYDANVLEFPPQVTEGPFLKDVGTTSFNVKPSFTYGYVEVACALLTATGASGSGVLASFTAKVKGGYPGYTTIDLVDTVLLDVEGAPIDHAVTSGYLVVKTPVASFTYENISNYGLAYPLIVNNTLNTVTSEINITDGVKYVFEGTTHYIGKSLNDTTNIVTIETDWPADVPNVLVFDATNIGNETLTKLRFGIYFFGNESIPEIIDPTWINAFWSWDGGATWHAWPVTGPDDYGAENASIVIGPSGGWTLDVNQSLVRWLKIVPTHPISAGARIEIVMFEDADGSETYNASEEIYTIGDSPIDLHIEVWLTNLLTGVYIIGNGQLIGTDWFEAYWSPDGTWTWGSVPITNVKDDYNSIFPYHVRFMIGPAGGFDLSACEPSTTYIKIITKRLIYAGFNVSIITFIDLNGDYDYDTGEPIVSDGDEPVDLDIKLAWGCPYTEFFFDASGSFSPLGYNITTYIWDFNDTTVVTTTSPNITHIFSYREEPYLVNLTVVDELGQTGSMVVPITIWRDAVAADIWPSVTWLDTVDYELAWGQLHEDPDLAEMGFAMFVLGTVTNLGVLPETITARLHVYDAVTGAPAGWVYPSKVTTTLDPMSGSGFSIWFLWSPFDEYGNYLPPGTYTMELEVDPVPCELEYGDVSNNYFYKNVTILPAQLYLNQYEVTYWTPSYGECFEVDLYVDYVVDLYGFEFNMTWDPALIHLEEFNFGAKLDAVWGEGNWEAFYNDTGIENGWFYMAATALPPAEGYTAIASPTRLVNFVFSVAYDPSYASPGYYNTTLIDMVSCKLSTSWAGAIPVSFSPANYTIYSSKPALEVRIPEGSITYEANALGTVFEAEIWLINATNVHDFWVLVEYNTTILDCLSVEINTNETWFPGPYVADWYYIDESTGFIEIYLEETLDAPTANGNGPIATIKFQVTEGITWKRGVDRFLYSLLNITGFGVSVNDPILGVLYLDYPDVIDFFPGEYWFLPKIGDASLDGAVNVIDLYMVASILGAPENVADWYDLDFSHNGVVDIYDLVIVATHIGA